MQTTPETLFHAPAALETNALMTASVRLSLLASGALRIEPEMDAKLFGYRGEEIAAERIRELTFLEGRGRLLIAVEGREEPIGLRGPGALMARVWLSALREAGGVTKIRVFPCAAERALGAVQGHLILSKAGFGIAGEGGMLTGGPIGEWHAFAELLSVSLSAGRLQLGLREGLARALSPSGTDTAAAREALISRWLSAQEARPALSPAPSAPAQEAAPWAMTAAVRQGDTTRLGVLRLDPAGLALHAADGGVHLLLERAHAAKIEEEPQGGRLEAASGPIHLRATSIGPLRDLLASVEWHTRADAVDVLTKEDLRLLRPRPRYLRLWSVPAQGEPTLIAEQFALSSYQPAPLSFRLNLQPRTPPPSLPCPVRVEIGSRRGRFFVSAMLYVAQPLPDSPLLTYQLRWVDRPADANRRAAYRISLTESVEDLVIEGRASTMASLKNLSSSGAALLCEDPLPVGARCRFGIRLPTDPAVLKDAHIPPAALQRYGPHPFLRVQGTVRWVRAEGRRHWLGIEFDANPWLGQLFSLRERELLRRLADMRTGSSRRQMSSMETLNNLDPSLPRTR